MGEKMTKPIKKLENRGGKREGAGRPPGKVTLSQSQLQEFQHAARKFAKEHGKTLEEVVLAIAYDKDAPRRDQLAAAKLFWDKAIIHATEGGEVDKALGPAFYLPEKRPVLKAVK